AIRPALELALAGDTVIVADGLYQGYDDRELDFHGRNLTVRSANGPANCTLDCQGEGRAFNLHTNESLASRIQGFTIRNGVAPRVDPQYVSNQGGGILALAATPTIVDCVVSDCAADYQGGGMWLFGGRVENCTFAHDVSRDPNSTSYGAGGGLFAQSAVVVVGCRFERNEARAGAGLFAASPPSTPVQSL